MPASRTKDGRAPAGRSSPAGRRGPTAGPKTRAARQRTPPIKVLVVDDHRIFAEALAVAVRLEKGFEVRVALSGTEAVSASARQSPDVVLMDVEMPGMDGVTAIRRLREAHPRAAILALTAHDEDLVKARVLEAGAIGHLSKETPLSDIGALIRQAHAGEMLMEQSELDRLMRFLHHRRHQDSTERQRVNRLSPRQLEILQMIADGLTSAQIVERLNVTPPTLRTHVQNILTRLHAHTKLEAVAIAGRHGKIRVHR